MFKFFLFVFAFVKYHCSYMAKMTDFIVPYFWNLAIFRKNNIYTHIAFSKLFPCVVKLLLTVFLQKCITRNLPIED